MLETRQAVREKYLVKYFLKNKTKIANCGSPTTTTQLRGDFDGFTFS
jgi:hypothetical protein